MNVTFLGTPFLVWGGVCFVLSIIWVRFWPSDRAAGVDAIRRFILRWFHALVWLLLAVAAWVAASGGAGGAATARIVAFLALITYLVFMFTLLTSGRPPT
jgi:hypothetical protein